MIKNIIRASLALFITYNGYSQKSTIDVKFMDKEVKAVNDFFLFSNGEWIKNNEIPASESRWGSFNELDEANKEKLTEILDRISNYTTDPGSDEQRLGDFYASYIDMKKRNQEGYSELLPYLKEIEDAKNFEDITAIIAQHHLNGLNTLFSFGVGQDLKNVDQHVYYLSQGGIGLPNKEYYSSDDKRDILNKYEEYIEKNYIRVFNRKNDAMISADVVIRFESALADKMFAPSEMRIPEKTYNKTSMKDLKKQFGSFDFNLYLSKLGIDAPDTLIVGVPPFIKNIPLIMTSFSIKEWKDYLKWCAIRAASSYLDQEFVDLHFGFYGGTLRGRKELKKIQDRAIEEITDSELSESLGRLFVVEYFSPQAKTMVNEMVDNLLIVFRARINNLDWMSSETKKEALIKLNAIGRKLGYPDKWEDYSALKISRDSYFKNIVELNKYSVQKNYKKINEPVDKDEWGMPAHMVNAYYHPLLNEIAFPAGIMQAPFFDENAEDAVNYGRIGMVIGHEFTHGFDDMGSKFAADGTFKNWWTEEDRKLFEEKTKMLGETYSHFCPITDNCVNPELTMGENIADLGGLTMAFHAYKMTEEFKKGEIRNAFTPAQRFFIAYAQLWKIKYTDEEMKNRIANDSHSPGMYRVNGPLMNCPEFFEAFDVKESDPMRNEEMKVSKIW